MFPIIFIEIISVMMVKCKMSAYSKRGNLGEALKGVLCKPLKHAAAASPADCARVLRQSRKIKKEGAVGKYEKVDASGKTFTSTPRPSSLHSLSKSACSGL